MRVLKIAERLAVQRATLAQLAQEFDVCERTIRRDLEALSVAGIQVRNTADACQHRVSGFWWVDTNQRRSA